MDEMVRRKNQMNATKSAEANEEDQLDANNNEMETAGEEQDGGPGEGEGVEGVHNNFDPVHDEDERDGDDLLEVIYIKSGFLSGSSFNRVLVGS